MPNTAEPEPEPVITKKIDGRITEAKCSVCNKELDLGIRGRLCGRTGTENGRSPRISRRGKTLGTLRRKAA